MATFDKQGQGEIVTFPIPDDYRDLFTADQWQAYCQLQNNPLGGITPAKLVESITAQRGLSQQPAELVALARLAARGDVAAVVFWLLEKGIDDPLLVFNLMDCAAREATKEAAKARGKVRSLRAGKPNADQLTEAIIREYGARDFHSKTAAATLIAKKLGLSPVTVRKRLKGVERTPPPDTSLLNQIFAESKKTLT